MQPRKIICQGGNHTKKTERIFNVENLPQSEMRKNHGTFVGVHSNIHYNNLGTKPNSKLGSTPSFQHNQKMHFKIPKTMKSSKYSE